MLWKQGSVEIGEERVIRLITRMLKSGIMEDGMVHASEEGMENLNDILFSTW
jgi:hypothetical protein